ncbi:hypothetical protein PHMEG_00033084 [Phytophthora megakarya]|uniref:Ubiquitin-like protease family profile domain-containing protein n=1 Tax=Phytophthora megakarya TaxID=4795 RepID=A0A225UU43_9STRA|nr:hypothetical protein PHMEG_00033084 [Phytophthora megakarya]
MCGPEGPHLYRGNLLCTTHQKANLTCNAVTQTVQLGLEMQKWLLEDGLPALPAQYHEAAATVANQVLTTYPFKSIQGLGNHTDYNFAMLYRALPPSFAGFQNATIQTSRTRTAPKIAVNDSVLTSIRQAVDHDGVATVFLPLNFHNALHEKNIFLRPAKPNRVPERRLNYREQHKKPQYVMVPQNSLIQFDAFSCGVFVCWMFIRQVLLGPPST